MLEELYDEIRAMRDRNEELEDENTNLIAFFKAFEEYVELHSDELFNTWQKMKDKHGVYLHSKR